MDTQTESSLVYRPSVALILEDPRGQVLIGERRDVPGSWQFPQGGVAETESLEEALHREVEEEILLPPHRYSIQQLKGPYRYLFEEGMARNGWCGQEQLYFHARLLTDEPPLKMNDTSKEFRALRWIAPPEFRMNWLPPMKWKVYKQVFKDFFGEDIS
jgi:putative (di)nucleoside polyphosphate hydrolase